MARADRLTVDLSAYPDLVVIYLGQRVNSAKGLRTAFKLGRPIQQSVAAKPDGLLLHETIIWGFLPPHVRMRQYWRDYDSLERWARSLPHQEWWRNFLRDTGGTGFWHEVYFRSGGMEAIFDSMPKPLGLSAFAPLEPARGRLFSARSRAGRRGAETAEPALSEEELYRSS
jgi:fumigallin biosynthesis monooxygenase-like protein